MNNRFSRFMTAMLLAFSLWTSAIAAIALPATLPQQDNKTTAQQQDSKNKQDKQTTASTTTTATGHGKPLATDEDPAMIGKRKINGGFISWMAGGLEKEVALGRQLAAEVDREAKFIDDPVVTEYVNRVGQNIVLHSDAKVPFPI